MDFLFVIQITPKRIELRHPELLVVRQPHGGLLHGLGGQFAADDPPLFQPRDQAGVLQHAQVLHESRQRHPVRLRQFGHAGAALGEPLHDLAPGRIGKRPEHAVENLLVGCHITGRDQAVP